MSPPTGSNSATIAAPGRSTVPIPSPSGHDGTSIEASAMTPTSPKSGARPTAAAVALAYFTPSPGAKSSPMPPAAAQLLKKIALDAASKAADQLCGGQTPSTVPRTPPARPQTRSGGASIWSASTVEYGFPDGEEAAIPDSIEVATSGSAGEHVGKRRASPVNSPARSAKAAKLARNLDAAAAEAGAVPKTKSHSAELVVVKKEGE